MYYYYFIIYIYNGTVINNTKSYVYLGNSLDPSLILNENFYKSVKKASSRLQLLYKTRPYLTLEAALNVYKMMILPILTYSSIIKLQFTKTELTRLTLIENRAHRIIENNELGNNVTIPTTVNVIKKNACVIVRNILFNKVCENFRNYFKWNNHSINNAISRWHRAPMLERHHVVTGLYFYVL